MNQQVAVQIRPHPVFVSTVPLRVQLRRLEDALPQIRELVLATAPADPRHADYLEMLTATTQAIEWLRSAVADRRPRMDPAGLESLR